MSLLSRIPWFIAAPLVMALGLAMALTMNYLGGPYFERTFLEEENPLLGAGPGQPTPTVSPSPTTQSEVAATPANEPAPSPTDTPATSGPVIVSSGEFRNGAPGHFGSGTATLGKDADGNAVLVLSDFSVTNGPDLRVILGLTEDGGGTGVDLGALKATDGTFSYEVPADLDLGSFKSVTIWCKSFPTIFAVATLRGS